MGGSGQFGGMKEGGEDVVVGMAVREPPLQSVRGRCCKAMLILDIWYHARRILTRRNVRIFERT